MSEFALVIFLAAVPVDLDKRQRATECKPAQVRELKMPQGMGGGFRRVMCVNGCEWRITDEKLEHRQDEKGKAQLWQTATFTSSGSACSR